MRAILIIATAAALGACQHFVDVKSSCIPMKAYTKEEYAALADALESLPGSSPLVGAMEDYDAMRRADRRCIGSHL